MSRFERALGVLGSNTGARNVLTKKSEFTYLCYVEISKKRSLEKGGTGYFESQNPYKFMLLTYSLFIFHFLKNNWGLLIRFKKLFTLK